MILPVSLLTFLVFAATSANGWDDPDACVNTLLVWSTATCLPCHQLQKAAESLNYVIEFKDAEADVQGAKQDKVTSYPTILVVDEKGRRIKRVLGFAGKVALVALCKEWRVRRKN